LTQTVYVVVGLCTRGVLAATGSETTLWRCDVFNEEDEALKHVKDIKISDKINFKECRTMYKIFEAKVN